MLQSRHMTIEAGSSEKLGRRELTLGYITARYEQPLLTGLWNRWGVQTFDTGQKRGWLVCGPARNTHIRIINWKSGIPITPYGNTYTEEHLRASQRYFYNPPSGKFEDGAGVDHEFLSYFNGKGSVIHIDPTWRLLWGNRQHLTGNDDLRGSILLQRFHVSEYENALREIYHLYPFDPNNKIVQKTHAHYGVKPQSPDVSERYFMACNSDQITETLPMGRLPSDPYERTGAPLAEFIRTIIPEWTGIK